MELGEDGAVLVVCCCAVDEGEDGCVLQLPCPGVSDGPLVGRGRGQAHLGQVVAVDEVGQHERGVDRGDHAGEVEYVTAVCDDLGHGLGLDGVPQLDDGQPGHAAVGQPFQLGQQVFAQRAAGAVVDQRGLVPGQFARSVTHQAPDRARGRCGQVVVECDAARHGVQQAVHDLPAGVGVEPSDDDDRQGHDVLP